MSEETTTSNGAAAAAVVDAVPGTATEATDAGPTGGAVPTGGGVGGFDWAGFGDMVNRGITTVLGEIEDAHVLFSEPCGRVAHLEAQRETLEQLLGRLGGLAHGVQARGEAAVQQALAAGGRPGAGYAGATPWPQALAEGPLSSVPPYPGGPPLGPARALWAADRLAGDAKPGGEPGHGSGVRLAPGVWLWLPDTDATELQVLLAGQLRGSAVRTAWWAWRRRVRAEVGPPELRTWRAIVASLVGPDWDGGEPARYSLAGGVIAALRACHAAIDRDIVACDARQQTESGGWLLLALALWAVRRAR